MGVQRVWTVLLGALSGGTLAPPAADGTAVPAFTWSAWFCGLVPYTRFPPAALTSSSVPPGAHR